MADPARLDVRGTLVCGQDVEIDINAIFEGQVTLGDGVKVGANCVIRNAVIGHGAVIHPFCHIEGDQPGSVAVGEGSLIGPFARLRPGARLGTEVHIGNFVEVKNSVLADGAKANHLAYLGDALVGERVNYGAGSITANYDGANKHRTVIEADVHVGSNCVLVAPVTIGAGSTVGGGSTITKDVPPRPLGRGARQAGDDPQLDAAHQEKEHLKRCSWGWRGCGSGLRAQRRCKVRVSQAARPAAPASWRRSLAGCGRRLGRRRGRAIGR